MRINRNPKLTIEPDAHINQRRHGRLRCFRTYSTLGEVIDLSASGIRVLHKGKPPLGIGDTFTIKVQSRESDLAVSLPARIVWIESAGRRKQHIGMTFLDLDDATQSRLARLARYACDQLIFRCA